MGFLHLLRNYYEHFELCEFYSYWCVGAHQKRINMDKVATRAYYDLVWERSLCRYPTHHSYPTQVKFKVYPALRNNKNYECGGPGPGSDAANQLCRMVFGVDCL